MKKRDVVVAALIVGLILCVVTFIVIAVPTWFKSFTWTGQSNQASIEVYSDASRQTLWLSGSEPLGNIVVGSQIVKTFYVFNDGFVPATVTITNEVNSNPSNTINWNPTTINLLPGEAGSMTLTITVNAVGNANYDFEFSAT